MPGPIPRLLTIGDNVVDRYVERGVMFPGGNTVNVAVHARRLGADTAYVGAVGTDRAGQVVLNALRAEEVDTRATRIIHGANAAATVHIIDGNRVFAGGSAGVSVFTPSATELDLAAHYDIVHTGECSRLEDDLLRLAKAARRLSFDFSERPWDYVSVLAPAVDIAIVSLPHGKPDQAVDLARRIRELGPSVVAVTLGPLGAVLDDGHTHVAPAGAGPVVDTLGAGDAFIARLLVGLASSEPSDGALRAATEYASASCATFGAFGHEASIDGEELSPALPVSPTPATEG